MAMPQTVEEVQRKAGFSVLYDIMVVGDERCWNAESLKLWTLKSWCLRSICCGKLTQQWASIRFTILKRYSLMEEFYPQPTSVPRQ